MLKLKEYAHNHRIIERHKNPFGIFIRIPTYLLLFWGLYNHSSLAIAIALSIEVGLWLLIPPAIKTFKFINEVVKNELLWLKAKFSTIKFISAVLLCIAML
jgi:hypothetical protein